MAATARDVLRHYKIIIHQEFGSEMRVLCPFHNDTNPSLDMNENGKWICRAGCGGGGLVTFVMKKERVPYHTAELLLENDFSLVIGDDLTVLTRIIDKLETDADSFDSYNPLNKEIKINFIVSILNNLSQITKSHSQLAMDWYKVLVYVASDTESHDFNDYRDLFAEFLNDLSSIGFYN